MSAVVSIQTQGAVRKFNKLKQMMEEQGRLTRDDLIEMGKQFARSIVPVYTGRTHEYIIARKGENSDGSFGVIVAKNPTVSDGHVRNIGNFNLVRWMHTSPNSSKHIKSGDRKFMYTTRDYLNGTKKRVATGRYRKIKLR